MVFILNEDKARKIFSKYRNVAAFTLGSSKGISENGLEISYAKLGIIPDQDTINAVVNGDLSAKKVIKKAVNAIHTPSAENAAVNIAMAEMINIICPEKNNAPKKGPNILVFVTDNAEDKATKAATKFLVRYITALFMEFGVEPVTDGKMVKKTFKGSKKKVVKKVAEFMSRNSKVRVSSKGYALKKALFAFYAIELYQATLAKVNLDDLGRKQVEILADRLKNVYINDNLKALVGFGGKKAKKKDEKKLMKALVKKNAAAVEAYDELREILNQVNPGVAEAMPKVKHGYVKKGKKKGTPKMNVKKFIKFYSKGKNVVILMMIYAHTAYTLLGYEVGTSAYNKKMTEVCTSIGEDGFSKAYIAAAKAYAKGQNVTVG